MAGAGDGTVSEDDFQQAWTHEAEDALVAAWTSAKAVGGQEGLQQLAVDVCAAQGTNSTQVSEWGGLESSCAGQTL